MEVIPNTSISRQGRMNDAPSKTLFGIVLRGVLADLPKDWTALNEAAKSLFGGYLFVVLQGIKNEGGPHLGR